MKYCTHCGAELADEAVICPKCGCAVGNVNPFNAAVVAERSHWDPCAIVGFVLALAACVLFIFNMFGLMSIAGLAVSIVGAVRTCRMKLRGLGLAIAGICVGAVTFFFWFYVWVYAFGF